jgi:hypothetical protein
MFHVMDRSAMPQKLQSTATHASEDDGMNLVRRSTADLRGA